ncbi:MAG: HAMP domain-containing histidine kinase [Ruminococcaceae bacterium]|nr:HAMP domain-containing histidine kinase [Oscillospiraceae bacterium]
MDKKFESKQYRSNRIGIKWKMFALLIIFTVFAILIIWVCGIQMVSRFYQSTKFNELKFANTSVSAALGDTDRLHSAVMTCAEEYSVDIWVYSISPNAAYKIYSANGTGVKDPIFLNKHMFAMYETATKNEGRYIAIVPMHEFEEGFEMHVLSDNMGDPHAFPSYHNHSSELVALSITTHEIDGTKYAILQASDLTPVSAMVKTMENQFSWIGVMLIILVLIFAEVMSRLITKPFINMNKAAKSLAKGDYSAEFSGKGYREISELADTLNYAAEELSRSDALKQELIANLSHDLRTPLTMIKGYGEVMRDIPGENTPENIQVIIDETERLSELVNEVFDLSKIQSGAQKPNFEIFSLTDIVSSTMHRYEKLTEQDGYRIEFSEDGNADVCADRGMILQVVYNLINNAINYTGEDKCVFVKQEKRGDNVRISVTDTGEGISAAQIPLIWDRYYKVDKVHKRAKVGMGLGLSIVKEILELHNATYGVESAIGKGSTFWFELTTITAEIVDNDI